jgi:hypothetical protein
VRLVEIGLNVAPIDLNSPENQLSSRLQPGYRLSPASLAPGGMDTALGYYPDF